MTLGGKVYRHIDVVEGVCGGEPVVKGTRLKPEQVVAYGSKEEAMGDFGLSLQQVHECHAYVAEKRHDTMESKGSQEGCRGESR